MGVLAWISAVFAFRTLPVTVLSLVLYLAVFASTIWIHEVPASPPRSGNRQRGLDLETAWKDLQHITPAPHPYNSHLNDHVRNYILDRVSKAAHGNHSSTVTVYDDLLSNATYAGKSSIIYFEGSNVLVRIEGQDKEKDAVLFSAHFDSVSTAPGATDDGMGVATLLNLVDYFAENTPKRTVIFNINNGEEDWLNGAHAFLEHPWAALPKTFLNLEGAGSAGRPLFFRTSNTAVTKASRGARNPHGTVLSSDAFKAGLVRSGTDFEVYEQAGLAGLDLAFYQRRSRYHTKYDSVAGLGGQKSLWSMMATALETGKGLVNMKDSDVQNGGGPAVYFDLYGAVMVVFGVKTMIIINAVLLGAGPLVVGLLLFVLLKEGNLLWTTRGWVRFPVSIALASGVTIGLSIAYAHINTFIVYSSSYVVLISLLCAFYVTLYASMKIASGWRPTHDTPQRSIILLETYCVWWLLLLLDTTSYLGSQQLGGLYFITFFNAGSLAALLVVLVEMMLARKEVDTVEPGADSDVLSGGESDGHSHQHSSIHDGDGMEVDAAATERTPLISGRNKVSSGKVTLYDNPWAMILWSLELILAATFPVILLSQLVLLLLTALSGTLADGNSPTLVYMAGALLSIFILLPLAPFMHKIHRTVPLVLSTLLALTVVYNLFAFPFSQSSPLKVYFQQTMDLDKGDWGSSNQVSLVGVPWYLRKHILPEIPSVVDYDCAKEESKKGLVRCSYSGLAPDVVPQMRNGSIKGDKEMHALLNFTTKRLTDNSGVITVRGADTRNCRLYFDDPVTAIRVKGGTHGMQKGWEMPSDGLKEVRLWSRTWDREWEVKVQWEGKVLEDKIRGRVACEWAELKQGRIPALDEVISFLPMWAVVSKYADGLVEGYKAFEM